MSSSRDTEVHQILGRAGRVLRRLRGATFDFFEVTKPPDLDYARHLGKVVSKLSPITANMIEFALVGVLNKEDWDGKGKWIRQDPGFPDTLFVGSVEPAPGIEIKVWFPLATEITARFKDSIAHLEENNTHVALLTWLPEYLLYGKPRIIDVWIGTAHSLALARDSHYHKPPDYLVIEPEDTTGRTRNLQQTNVAGYKFQGTPQELVKAALEVEKWGEEEKAYSHNPGYQTKLRQLMGRYRYRLDTNFAKIDRIQHEGVEQFKSAVLEKEILGHTIDEWSNRLIKDEVGLQTLLDVKPHSKNVTS